jgi:hypothetical protein
LFAGFSLRIDSYTVPLKAISPALQLIFGIFHMTDNFAEPSFNIPAAILGWLLPGVGHWKVGEKARGMLVLLGVGGLFLLGVLVGGVDCVDRREDGMWFIAQAGAGGLAFATDELNTAILKSGRVGELLPLAVQSGTVMVSSFKGAGPANEIGTLLCGLAGMMNVIAVLDVLYRPCSVAKKGAVE